MAQFQSENEHLKKDFKVSRTFIELKRKLRKTYQARSGKTNGNHQAQPKNK